MARRRLTSLLALVSMLLAIGTVVAPVQASDYGQIGVWSGGVADYSISYTDWEDWDAYLPVVAHVCVRSVEQELVTLEVTFYYGNGTAAYARTLIVNISRCTYPTWYFVFPAGLSAGDIFSDQNLYYQVPRVNATITMVAGGAERTVNCFIILGAFAVYWDKVTGLVVGSATSMRPKIPGAPMLWTNFTLTSTTLWGSPLQWIVVLAGIAVGLLVIPIAAVAYRRCR